jgi:hypothetical protein
MSDEEVKGLLDRIVRSFLKKGSHTKVKAKKGRKGEEVKILGKDSPHDIYLYDPEKDVWRLLLVNEDLWTPTDDGLYVIYFDNIRCPACRIYDVYWYDFVKKRPHDAKYLIVLCSWFSLDCSSRAAARTFEEYGIHASPTTLFLCRKEGKTKFSKKYEGVLSTEELITVLANLKSLCFVSIKLR